MAANQTLSKNLFTWGEAVQVCKSAPKEFRPDAYASVCGLRQICADTSKYPSLTSECSYLYTIEYYRWIIGGSA